VNITLVTGPAQEPVALAAAKEFLKVEHNLEDSFIERLIVSARQRAEQLTRNQLMTATWKLTLGAFCDEIRLPKPPLQLVTSVQYIDTAGTLQTVSAADYQVDLGGRQPGVMGRVVPAYGKVWPTARDELESVRVTFVAGWGDDPDEVPGPLVDWIMVQVATHFENRQLLEPGQLTELRFVDALLRPYTVRLVA
jgi:uncharacterized phiE125 gp8 family phage protein